MQFWLPLYIHTGKGTERKDFETLLLGILDGFLHQQFADTLALISLMHKGMGNHHDLIRQKFECQFTHFFPILLSRHQPFLSFNFQCCFHIHYSY